MTTHKLGNQPKQLRPFNHSQKRGALLRKIAIYADELDKNQYPTWLRLQKNWQNWDGWTK